MAPVLRELANDGVTDELQECHAWSLTFNLLSVPGTFEYVVGFLLGEVHVENDESLTPYELIEKMLHWTLLKALEMNEKSAETIEQRAVDQLPREELHVLSQSLNFCKEVLVRPTAKSFQYCPTRSIYDEWEKQVEAALIMD